MLQRRSCALHPDRPGHAACVVCRTVLCAECATAYDGIFHCARCLAARQAGGRRRRAPVGWALMLLATAALLFASVRLAVWSGVLLAGLR
jgi:hypothetical protein